MAFDGITVAGLVKELKDTIIEGRLFKIAQTESDELMLTIKKNRELFRLLISANASLPLIYLTQENKPAPLTAPNFCMLLRKHISNGRIVSISQPGLERIINFQIEHLDELGDLRRKTLVCEFMGKHSNIIFCDDQNQIIDSIKRIPASVSSVREVLPGREYFIPNTQDKINPRELTEAAFDQHVFSKHCGIGKALYTSLTGFSPMAAYSICADASLDSEYSADLLSEDERVHLYHIVTLFMEGILADSFSPRIYYKDRHPEEYSAVPLQGYEDCTCTVCPSVSEMLSDYYAARNVYTRIRQKSSDLRRVVSTALEKDRKKYALQVKQQEDTKKMEKYKVYGELLTTYGYSAQPEAKSITVTNYYDNQELTIPLDPSLSAIDNAKKYFDRYSKLKRTAAALEPILTETQESIRHLESVANSLEIATDENSLKEIREELIQWGYIRRPSGKKKKERFVSKPLHYVTPDGFHIYVGKNNFQNEDLTFNLASGNDWWFHAKGIPGSHVIVKANNQELPDHVYEDAGALAAYYSKGRDQEKVEIDYTQKKQIKKVAGAKPGFVIYHTNYSLLATPSVDQVTEVTD